MKLPSNCRVFSDVTSVSRTAVFNLVKRKLINDDNTLKGWVILNPFIRDRKLSDVEAKQLVLLELYRDDGGEPRMDIVDRLVNYITNIDREHTRSAIAKLKR